MVLETLASLLYLAHQHLGLEGAQRNTVTLFCSCHRSLEFTLPTKRFAVLRSHPTSTHPALFSRDPDFRPWSGPLEILLLWLALDEAHNRLQVRTAAGPAAQQPTTRLRNTSHLSVSLSFLSVRLPTANGTKEVRYV
jgi:hypothetical protein